VKTILHSIFSIAVLVGIAATPKTNAAPSDPAWEKDRMFQGSVDLKQQAEHYLAQSQFAKAAGIFGEMAELAKNVQAAAWARVQEGDAYLAAGDIEAARNAYEDAIETYPAYIDFKHVLQKLRDIANFYAANQASLLGIPVTRVNRAIEIYELILTKAPAGTRAPYDTLRLAKLQAAADEEEEAKITLGEVIRKFPASKAAPLARLELATLLIKQAEEQQNYFQLAREARRQARQFIRFHPGHEDRETAELVIQRAENRIAEHYLTLGRFYAFESHFNAKAARRYYTKVLQDFPDTPAATTARQEITSLPVSNDPTEIATAKPAEPKPVEPPKTVTEKPAPRPEPAVAVVEPDPDETPTYSTEELRSRENITRTLLPRDSSGLPEFDSIAVGKLQNDTREPQITTYLKNKLAEQIMIDPDVKLLQNDDADIIIEAKIDDITYAQAASAKIRDEGDTPDELGTYSTTIFRTYVDIDYRVLDAKGNTAVDWTRIRGEADFPETPDLNINRQASFQQACNDAALRIIGAITEAW
jgi:TolA-binding protein